jgi:hypothetical protein
VDIIGFWLLLLVSFFDYLFGCLDITITSSLFIMYEIESLLALALPLIRLYLLYSNTHPRKDDSMANACRGVGQRMCKFPFTSRFTTTEIDS